MGMVFIMKQQPTTEERIRDIIRAYDVRDIGYSTTIQEIYDLITEKKQ